MSHGNDGKINPTLWSQAQSAQAAEHWQIHFVDHHGDDDPFAPELSKARYRVLHQIAKAIGRSYSSVEHRLETYGASFGTNRRSSRMASARELSERDARKEAICQQSLTAQIFGDPPPGFSALDRRNAQRGLSR